MPLALVLTLTPEDETPWPLPGGREIQGWFLGQVQALDPALAQTLHASSGGRRPYTLSALMDMSWHPVAPRTPFTASVGVRVTALTPPLEALLREEMVPRWQRAPGVRLGEKTFILTAVAMTPAAHPWAGAHTWAELVQWGQARHEQPGVRLHFASPTAFRSQGADIPLPAPEHILRSWWLAWNATAPDELQLDAQWPHFAAACVQVQRLRRVHTLRWRWRTAKGSGAVGFIGLVDLRLRKQRPDSPWMLLRPGAEAVLHTLAAFSFYAGTGHHTTIGMGQTRPVV